MSGRWDADVTPATVLQWARDLAGVHLHGRCTMTMGSVGDVWVERASRRMTLWYGDGRKAVVLDLDASPEVWLSQIEQALA